MSPNLAADGSVVLGHEESRHICRVLRHRKGDRVFATDGCGTEYELELTEVKPERVAGRVHSRRVRPREPRAQLTLAQAVIKGDKFFSVVEGAVQLGVSRVIPIQTRRTVAGLSAARLERLRGVAAEAVKCSTRTVIPEITECKGLDEIAASAQCYDRALVAYEDESEARGLEDLFDSNTGTVLLIIGPEGGFESDEIGRLAASGVKSFSLGPRRFRSETAGVVATALVLYLLGDLGGREHKEPIERRC